MGKVPAASHTLAILRTLASRGACSASTLAADLQLPRSTVYHLLATLRETGFVVHRESERRWSLGPSAVDVGLAALRQDPRDVVVRPHLIRLAEQVNETVHLGVLQGAEVLYLMKESRPGISAAPTLITAVGVRLPATTTASGRAILARLPFEQVRALTATPTAFVSRTERGPRSLSQLRSVLDRERRQGYSVEIGEIMLDHASIAAPILDVRQQPTAAVSVTVRCSEADFADRADDLSAAVIATAERINAAR